MTDSRDFFDDLPDSQAGWQLIKAMRAYMDVWGRESLVKLLASAHREVAKPEVVRSKPVKTTFIRSRAAMSAARTLATEVDRADWSDERIRQLMEEAGRSIELSSMSTRLADIDPVHALQSSLVEKFLNPAQAFDRELDRAQRVVASLGTLRGA